MPTRYQNQPSFADRELNVLPPSSGADSSRPLAETSLADAWLDTVLVVDADGKCLMASPAAQALLGYEREELLRVRIRDVIFPGAERGDGPEARDFTAAGWQGELQVRRKHGELLLVEGWSIPLMLTSGNAVAIFLRAASSSGGAAAGIDLLAADVSSNVMAGRAMPIHEAWDANQLDERTRAEQELRAAKATANDANRALRESEARFRSAFDGASIGMALVAVDGRLLQVNPALCGIVGYSEDELLARTFQEITHPDHLDSDRELVRQLLANEISSYQIEKFYLRKQGEVICGRLTASLVRGAGDEPLYFVSQIQDITPFKAAGAALREAEARYRTLVEQTPASVYVDSADALGSPLYVSPRVETLLGFTPEQWVATPDLWWQRVHPDDRERILAEVARVNETGEDLYLEYRFITRDGRVVWVHDEAALVYDEEGNRQCWQGFMIDITDRKRAEEELRAAKEAAEEASRLKSAFLSMATHELRTPLTIISGYVELLADSATGHLTPDEREFIDIMQTSTKNLAALVNDLLDLARIEAGRLDVAISPVDIAEVIDRVRRMVAAQADAKGLDLKVVVAPDLPPVAADVNRLIQVLLNLFGNAIKFTEQGHVHAAVCAARTGVEITVADTGIGIAPEALPRIFDEFRQADSGTTRRFGGTGLGLAIAKRLVEMHGGTISVESEVDIGSTFTLWLPAADVSLELEEIEPIPCSPLPSR